MLPEVTQFEDTVTLVCDTGMWDPNTPAITTSLRGLMYDEVTIKAANRDLHSGIFGGGAQNPIRVLTKILGGLFDDNGRITIPGFYDGIRLTAEDRRILQAVPDDEAALLKLFGVSEPDLVGESLQEALQYPSLNIRGLESAYVGASARTIIPDRAVAEIDVRLVTSLRRGSTRRGERTFSWAATYFSRVHRRSLPLSALHLAF